MRYRPRRSRYDELVVRAALVVALAGCSYATMQKPEGSRPVCTESTWRPVLDIVVALASPYLMYRIVKAADDGPQP